MNAYFKLIERLNLDPQLVLVFFVNFSRFEYALKKAGFTIKGKNEATPDWDTYSNTLPDSFTTDGDEHFLSAIAYLKQHRPRKQVVEEGSLTWKDTPKAEGESDAHHVFRLVRCVRNNLFHGGKYRAGPLEDPVRDAKLLHACVRVLERALPLNPDVMHAFEEVV